MAAERLVWPVLALVLVAGLLSACSSPPPEVSLDLPDDRPGLLFFFTDN